MNKRLKDGPGNIPLYFNNQGLFDDHFLQKTLPEIEKHENQIGKNYQGILDYWNSHEFDTDESEKFVKAFNGIIELYKKKESEFDSLDESQLEEEFIKPVLNYLGWSYTVQYKYKIDGKNIRKPDYALFTDEDNKKASKDAKGNNGFKYISVMADAKRATVDLDGRGSKDDNPSYQIVEYMEDTGTKWGILSNGRFWRIYSLNVANKVNTFFEIDLDSIVEAKDESIFKYFYMLFRKNAFVQNPQIPGKTFIDVLFDEGLMYADQIEDSLKVRAFDIVEIIANGVKECSTHNKSVLKSEKEVLDASLYYLFKLMFVLNCESKGLLNVSDTSKYYPSSLRYRLINKLLPEFNSATPWNNRYTTHYFMEELFAILNVGDHDIGIHGFGELVFELGKKHLDLNVKISDKYINKALVMLSSDKDPKTGERHFIDFKKLGVDHLGSVFEGLLEFSLEDSKDGYLLVNEDGDRERTGAFYTPEPIVDYICQNTLPDSSEFKTVDDILNYKVCDPAMGSGHFLVGAVKHLEKVAYKLQKDKKDKSENLSNEIIKCKILKNCVYGVDINPVAVELAKLSLWIYTAEKRQKLEPLNNNFLFGNSLHDKDENISSKFVWDESFSFKFNSFIGNPPYIRNRKIPEDMRKIYRKKYDLAIGAFDIYVCFYEKALKSLSDNGAVGYIVSNKITVADYAKDLRAALVDENTIHQLIDFTHSKKIFHDAAVVPVITIFNTGGETGEKIKIGTPALEKVNDEISEHLSVVKTTNIIGNNHKMELFKDSTALQILELLDEYPILDDSGFDIRTGIMGFEYWNHEEFVTDSISKKQNWKLITNALFSPLKNMWGKTHVRLYKKKISNPMLSKSDTLLSPETKAMFKGNKVVIRGVGKGINAFYDTEGCAMQVAIHGVRDPEYPYFTTFLFNSLLVDWIYAVKLLAGKIPQGSLKYPVDFLKNEITFNKVGINKVEAKLKKIYDSADTNIEKINQANEIILEHYGIPENLWSYMQAKVNETIETDYNIAWRDQDLAA